MNAVQIRLVQADTPQLLDAVREIFREYAASLGIEIDDFDLPPFSQQGGLGRVHQLFGAQLPPLLAELNRELAA